VKVLIRPILLSSAREKSEEAEEERMEEMTGYDNSQLPDVRISDDLHTALYLIQSLVNTYTSCIYNRTYTITRSVMTYPSRWTMVLRSTDGASACFYTLNKAMVA